MTAGELLPYPGSSAPHQSRLHTLIDGKKLKPTSILTFDSTKVDAKKLAALEEILYGKDPSSADADDGVEPRLPLPDEVIKIMTAEG